MGQWVSSQVIAKMATPAIITKKNCGEEVISTKFDIIGGLPVEIVENIFYNLSAEDIHSATSCCSRWRATVVNEYFWKKLCKRDDFFEVEEKYRSELYTGFLKKYSHWQGVYRYYHAVQHNWENNNYEERNYAILQTNNNFRTFLGDNIFAYHLVDSTELHVYNLKSKEFKSIIFSKRLNPNYNRVLDGPEFIKSEKYLIHFIRRNSLTVWNLEKGSKVYDRLCKFTFIHVDKNLILLDNPRNQFQVLDIETRQIEYEHEEMMNADIMDGRIVFTTIDNQVIHIIKWADKSEVTLKCCNQSSICKLLVKGDFLLSFCEGSTCIKTLCVWDIKTKTKLHSTFLGSSYQLKKVSFMNKYLCLDRVKRDDDCILDLIEFWDYTKGILVNSVIRLHSNTKLSSRHFMIASKPGKIIGLWCFRTMDFCDTSFGRYCIEYIPNVELSETMIIHSHVIDDHIIILRVRDYEI